jgi:hypothetical protein
MLRNEVDLNLDATTRRGNEETARRRQGYGGLAYLPAEASAKAGALFDIVNMKRAPIGMGAEPTGERAPAQRSRLAWATHFGQTKPRCRNATPGAARVELRPLSGAVPVIFPVIYRAGCVAHARGVTRATSEPGKVA